MREVFRLSRLKVENPQRYKIPTHREIVISNAKCFF